MILTTNGKRGKGAKGLATTQPGGKEFKLNLLMGLAAVVYTTAGGYGVYDGGWLWFCTAVVVGSTRWHLAVWLWGNTAPAVGPLAYS